MSQVSTFHGQAVTRYHDNAPREPRRGPDPERVAESTSLRLPLLSHVRRVYTRLPRLFAGSSLSLCCLLAASSCLLLSFGLCRRGNRKRKRRDRALQTKKEILARGTEQTSSREERETPEADRAALLRQWNKEPLLLLRRRDFFTSGQAEQRTVR